MTVFVRALFAGSNVSNAIDYAKFSEEILGFEV